MAALKKFDTSNPERLVLDNLVAEYERARDDREAATLRMARTAENIRILTRSQPPIIRKNYEDKLSELGHSIQNRAGDVFGKVISIFQQNPRKPMTFSDVQKSLEEVGTFADEKALYNSLNYLAKTGRITRVARGTYTLTDYGAFPTEYRDDGTIRRSENDD